LRLISWPTRAAISLARGCVFGVAALPVVGALGLVLGTLLLLLRLAKNLGDDMAGIVVIHDAPYCDVICVVRVQARPARAITAEMRLRLIGLLHVVLLDWLRLIARLWSSSVNQDLHGGVARAIGDL
jgi:hypothetical protein